MRVAPRGVTRTGKDSPAKIIPIKDNKVVL